MTMSRQAEEITNAALASLLRPMLPGCAVRSETTPTIAASPDRRPDILVTAPGSAPVILEAEYEPNANPEADARPRLGAAIIGEPRPVESVIALRYPEELAAAYDLPAALLPPASATASSTKTATASPPPAGSTAARPIWPTSSA